MGEGIWSASRIGGGCALPLAVGENTNIHQVMISLEKARLSLELVVQVRNKVLDAYQNMMQMQI